MNDVARHFQLPLAPIADPKAVVLAPHARFTILTSRLFRLEYSPTAKFEDRASQPFWYRRQPVPAFQAASTPERVEIETEHLHLSYDPRAGGFSPESLFIRLKATGVTWHCGDEDPGNLLGTARTLDQASGRTRLEQGLLSRTGWALVDDSRTLVFNQEGWLELRPDRARLDLYFFGYGHDYLGCLHDYRLVAGPVPLLPRWALGNWWSRYWGYTQEELKGLMEGFEAHGMPLSVCIVDMDWHIIQTGNACTGWTGFTWNRELWPDPEGFIRWLHGKGLRTALNIHPAEGVHPHEAQYEAMARAMGIDPAGREPVAFDIADPRFTRAYFELLFHPMEEQGVDFWWMDWQQGDMSALAGLDPLWWLNHLHFYDLGRDGTRRPFIFSRWGGLGNHRYPIGFSGDSVVTWESLAFQPYFTATASNVAYSWWSHDVGGHMGGIEDPELFIRWMQFGVFSPILRLHSTKNPFQDRRPWAHGAEVERILRDAMQLRHALIPYIYTMSWRNHTQDIPLIQPMYYQHPAQEEAYCCPNQYYYGSELLAAPYIQPMDPDTRLSRQVVWLPEGDWFGFFDGCRFEGPGWHALYGSLDEIPVFARAGTIVPLAPRAEWGGVANPDLLEIRVFPGADNRFELYEDDGQTMAYTQGHCRLTAFSQAWRGSELEFGIEAARGDPAIGPARRTYDLAFRGICNPDRVRLLVNGEEQPCALAYSAATDTLNVRGIALQASDRLSLTLTAASGSLASGRDRRAETCERMLRAFHLDTWAKGALGSRLPELVGDPRLSLLEDSALMLPDAQMRALLEVIVGAGFEVVTGAGEKEYLVLWNNRQVPEVRYRLAAWGGPGLYNSKGGTIPSSQPIPLAGLKPIRLRVDYLGLLALSWRRD